MQNSMTKKTQQAMEKDDHPGLLSIGGLAKACSIPMETLRNWERRYGFPSPVRRSSGHRRYQLEIVSRLSKIRRVVDLGYKPSFAVSAAESDLDAILNKEALGSSVLLASQTEYSESEVEIDLWLGKVLQMDAHRLNTFFQKAWYGIGARKFINKMAIPFLHRVGERWVDGRFTVAHEHFSTEVLQTFISSQWRPLAVRAKNGKVLLANLEGEFHSLRLHLAAVFLVLHDFEPIFLGPNTPSKDIVSAAEEMEVNGVVIGLSPCSDLEQVQAELNSIRKHISGDVVLICGGNPHLNNLEQITYLESFEELDRWCSRRTNQ